MHCEIIMQANQQINLWLCHFKQWMHSLKTHSDAEQLNIWLKKKDIVFF